MLRSNYNNRRSDGVIIIIIRSRYPDCLLNFIGNDTVIVFFVHSITFCVKKALSHLLLLRFLVTEHKNCRKIDQ